LSTGIFIPGWGAPASLYRRGLPEGWQVLELPTFRRGRGDLDRYREVVRAAVAAAEGPVALAGHSMGGALALLVAVQEPLLVERLVLVSPAGLPLEKSLRASTLTFLGQARRGSYSVSTLRQMFLNTAAAPLRALALARAVHGLDLSPELDATRALGIHCTVVACRSDRLTTCDHCSRLAERLGADYRELEAAEGHIWPIVHPELLMSELRAVGNGLR
jgi:pimeloyl-ACP methyl ester carboxylesterase